MPHRSRSQSLLADTHLLLFATLCGLAARSAAQGGGDAFFKRGGGGGSGGNLKRSAAGDAQVLHYHAGLRGEHGGGRRIVGGTAATGIYEWTTLITRLGVYTYTYIYIYAYIHV